MPNLNTIYYDPITRVTNYLKGSQKKFDLQKPPDSTVNCNNMNRHSYYSFAYLSAVRRRNKTLFNNRHYTAMR